MKGGTALLRLSQVVNDGFALQVPRQSLPAAAYSHNYGNMGASVLMKTTVEVSDDLYRRAKAEAALSGRKVKDLIEEGLRLVLEAPRAKRGRPSLARFATRVAR